MSKPNPPLLDVVVLQSALVARVGGARTMRGQLTRLREAADDPHIMLRVVPLDAGAASAMGAMFSIMDFSGAQSPPAVYIEGDVGARLARDAGVVSWSRRRFNAVPVTVSSIISPTSAPSTAGQPRRGEARCPQCTQQGTGPRCCRGLSPP
ncbi:Scr1 family TA system antitoxin-like transcriptional regulator [Kitasatospora sp. NPDC008050]|uniref:Scr1 family TA system antitoxin-like transcriptional regulator n=1 Tax=Kitasatospora sp. NPDC008050 TaxID=3364021 RepID=UPI0036E956DA